MKQLFLGGILILGMGWSHLGWGQTHSSIRSVRPGLSIGPFTTGKGILQIQSGLESNALWGENTRYRANSHVIRFGLMEHWELGVGLGQDQFFSTSGDVSLRPSSPYTLRSRWNIINATGHSPSLGFQAQIRIPWTDLSQQFLSPKLVLSAAKPLNNYLILTSNFGGVWEFDFMYFASINARIRPHLKWTILAELLREWHPNMEVNKWSFGMAYLVNPNFQLDFGVRNNARQMNEDLSSFVGLSYRFNTLKIK